MEIVKRLVINEAQWFIYYTFTGLQSQTKQGMEFFILSCNAAFMDTSSSSLVDFLRNSFFELSSHGLDEFGEVVASVKIIQQQIDLRSRKRRLALLHNILVLWVDKHTEEEFFIFLVRVDECEHKAQAIG